MFLNWRISYKLPIHQLFWKIYKIRLQIKTCNSYWIYFVILWTWRDHMDNKFSAIDFPRNVETIIPDWRSSLESWWHLEDVEILSLFAMSTTTAFVVVNHHGLLPLLAKVLCTAAVLKWSLIRLITGLLKMKI